MTFLSGGLGPPPWQKFSCGNFYLMESFESLQVTVAQVSIRMRGPAVRQKRGGSTGGRVNVEPGGYEADLVPSVILCASRGWGVEVTLPVKGL